MGTLSRHLCVSLLGLSLVTASSTAFAEMADWSGGVQPELELTSHLNDRLDIRFGVNVDRPVEHGYRTSGFASDHDGPLFSALVDWSPSDGGLRMTGGALYGEHLFSSGDIIPMPDLSIDAMRPYVGVGYDNDFGTNGRFGLSLDMGLTFNSVSSTGPSTDTQDDEPSDAALGSRFESFRYTPSFSAGVEYRF